MLYLIDLFSLQCSKHSKDANPTTHYGDYAALLEDDYIGTPEEAANLQETLKHALQSLKQDQWQSTIPALIKLMHISRIQPELLDSSMPRIYRSLCRSYIQRFLLYISYISFYFNLISSYCSLLKNTRPHVVRTVCQVAMELYKTVQCTQRPEFDELVSMLLLKSTHTNKGIRNDAQRALDSMVTHLPPAICIRILTNEHGTR